MSFTKFEKRHRTLLNLICDTENGIYNSTSARQKKNGTISLTDTETGISYSLHTSGYIRKKTSVRNYCPPQEHWQLNRTKTDYCGSKVKIMATADEQLIILLNAIERDRRAARINMLREEIITLQTLQKMK